MNAEVENELNVVAGCFLKDFFETIRSKMLPEYFRNFHIQDLYRFIDSYYVKYGKTPSRKILLDFAKSEEKMKVERLEVVKAVFLKIKELDEHEAQFFVDKCSTIARNCYQSDFFDNAYDCLVSSDTISFDRLVDEYVAGREKFVKSSSSYIPNDHASTFEERFNELIEDEEHPRKCFRIKFKDDTTDFSKILKYSLAPENGNVVCVFGDTGLGKSTILSNFAKMLVKQDFTVFDFILEGTYKYITSQYDSLFSGVPVEDIFSGKLTIEQHTRVKESMEKYKGMLYHDKFLMYDLELNDIDNIIDSTEQKIGKKIDSALIKPAYYIKSPYCKDQTPQGKTLHKIYIYEGLKRQAEKRERMYFVEDQVKSELALSKDLYSNMIQYCGAATNSMCTVFGLAATAMERARDLRRLQLIKSRMSANSRFQVKLRAATHRATFLNGW